MRSILFITISILYLNYKVKESSEISVFAFKLLSIKKKFVPVYGTSSKSSSTDLFEFKEWCTEQGILTPLNLRIRDDEKNSNERESNKYRFMEYSDDQSFTNRPETLDGPILRVPLKSCIIGESPEDLSIKLAKERDLGDESFFSPYIKVLPTLESSSLQCMPRMWPEEKMDKISEFDGGQIYKKVSMDENKNKDLDLDPWAYACVKSRANYLLDKGFAMTPILDMINHDSASQTSARIVEDELYLSLSKKFPKDKEVFISYGDLTNLETLCNYGFVSETNECNVEFVDVSVIRRQPVQVMIDDRSGGSLDAGSLATLRSYLTPPEVLEKLLETDSNLSINTVFTKPISETIEEDMYSLIASFVDEAIYQSNNGISWAKENQDGLLEKYFNARVSVLNKGLEYIKRKFPDLLY